MEKSAVAIPALKSDAAKLEKIEKAARLDQKMMASTSKLTKAGLLLRRQFLDYYFIRPPIWRVLLRAASKKPRMTPDFISLGAVRSGTSLLSDYIMQHPCVVLPMAKEIGVGGYLPTSKMMTAQFPTLGDKRAVAGAYGKAITGYCSPALPLAAFPYVAPQLAPVGSTKMIIILRNPVDRTFAHWRWDSVLLARAKKDPLWQKYPDFDEVAKIELASAASGGGGFTTFSGVGSGGYIQHSVYLPFLKSLFNAYPRENSLIVKAEDFFTEPTKIAKQVYEFLELPAYEPVATPVKNSAPKSDLDPATRAALVEFFEPLNAQLYDYLGRDFGWQ